MTEILILIFLILCNALFAGIEMAFVTLNDLKVENKAKEGNKKAILINKMLKQPSKFLATIQIGITFAGFLSSAVASSTFAEKLSPIFYDLFPFINEYYWNMIMIVIITIILSCFMLVFGELVPKRIAMKHSEEVSEMTINILIVISIIFTPFVYILTKITDFISSLFGIDEHEKEIITEEEIKMLVDECHDRGTLRQYEKKYIHNILEFNDIKIIDIMLDKKDMFTINYNMNVKEVVNLLSKNLVVFSKIPVVNDSEEIIGILHIKDLLKNIDKNIKINKIVRDVIFVNKNKVIIDVFNKLKRNKSQIAIICDNKDYIGMVTIEDILEEIVGDIKDEFGM